MESGGYALHVVTCAARVALVIGTKAEKVSSSSMKSSAEPRIKRDYVLVFGAAVRRNGRPSAALRQRINVAASWAAAHPRSVIIPTGAAGESGPAEARVVKDALVEAGVSPRRIIMELRAQDTLESVKFCHEMIERRGDCDRIVCCTSRYHQPRCALLLKMLGYCVIMPRVPITKGRMSWVGLARLFTREFVAVPYDALLLIAGRALKVD